MRVLIITHYFPPLNAIGSLRLYSWAKYWKEIGCDITILTTRKNRKFKHQLHFDLRDFRIIEVSLPWLFSKMTNVMKGENGDSINNSNKRNCRSFFWKRVKEKIRRIQYRYGIFFFYRMPDVCDWWVRKAYNKVKEMEFDIVVSSFAPYATHLVALRMKRKHRKVLWVADYRDLWTLDHLYKGMWPFIFVEEFLEKKINHMADIITTVSTELANKLEVKYGIKNVYVIENGFDPSELDKLPKEKYWRDGKVRFVYTGSIYEGKRDPSPFFRAMQLIANSEKRKYLEKLEVIFVGKRKGNLDTLIEKYKVGKWVLSKDFVSREESLRMQRDAHVLLFLEVEAPEITGILTGKLFEYLFSKTQIWGVGITTKSAAGKFIVDSKCGRVFGKDVNLIRESLMDLLITGGKPQITPDWNFLNNYTRKQQADKLMKIMEDKLRMIWK